jgi:hypothetical protein
MGNIQLAKHNFELLLVELVSFHVLGQAASQSGAVLGNIGNDELLIAIQLAGIFDFLPMDKFEQAGFAAAILALQDDPVTGLNSQIDAFTNQFFSLGRDNRWLRLGVLQSLNSIS